MYNRVLLNPKKGRGLCHMLQHGTNSEDFMLSLSQKDKCHIILLHEASSRAGSRWQVLGLGSGSRVFRFYEFRIFV